MENAVETKTTDSIIQDAMKEGIDFREDGDSPSPETQPKPDVTPASSAKPEEPVGSKPLPDGEKSVEQQFQDSKLPAHLFPRFRELYAENKKIKDDLKAKEELLRDPRVARLLAQGKEATQERQEEVKEKVTPKGDVTDEQMAALQQLKSMLGLDQYEKVIETLQKQNEELSRKEEDKAFDAEETELRKVSVENGLDYEQEVYPEITSWLQKNPQYQGLGPGSLKIAFHNIYFSKMGELAERKKNLEMIEAQKKLKQGNTESPNKAEKGKAPKTYRNDDEMIADLVKEAGGVEQIDFGA